MLSDKGSVVIRKFGILNTNVPPDVKQFYGIPFPGQYLIAPDGVVAYKAFLPEFQTRATASEVLLKETGKGLSGSGVKIKAGNLQARVIVSNSQAFSGDRLGVAVDFNLAPGWHVYGEPLPSSYTATAVKFNDKLVSREQVNFPRPEPLKLAVLKQTLPVYQGHFAATGWILLKQGLKPGEHKLAGTLSFQECNNEICKIPRTIAFAIPLRIKPLVMPAGMK